MPPQVIPQEVNFSHELTEEELQYQDYINQVAEQNRSGEEYEIGRPGTSTNKMKQILAWLKSKDEGNILQAVIELSSELSMLQDSSVTQMYLDQLVPPLIECLKKEDFPDVVRRIKS